MSNRIISIIKRAIAIFIMLIISIVMAALASILSFALSFVMFGDGSELYFLIKNALHIEPYFLTAITIAIITFISSWVVGIQILKNKSYKF
jgi:ABC-type antimicrobial peptide transport system permease subunit